MMHRLLAKLALSLLFVSTFFDSSALAVPQSGQLGYGQGVPAHVPILYEAYYPEPREWNPETSLREIERLRELTSQLLREEEQLGQLAAAAAENVIEPRNQVLRYVFSGNAPPPMEAPAPAPIAAVAPAQADDQVQVASLTISDVEPHKTRHHHGQANWLLRRLAA